MLCAEKSWILSLSGPLSITDIFSCGPHKFLYEFLGFILMKRSCVFCVHDSSNIVALNKKICIFRLVKSTHIGNQVVSNVEVLCLMKIYTCWHCCIQQLISCRKCCMHLILFQLVLVIAAVARRVKKSGVTKRKKGSSSVNRDEESTTCLLTKPKGFSSSILTFFFFLQVLDIPKFFSDLVFHSTW